MGRPKMRAGGGYQVEVLRTQNGGLFGVVSAGRWSPAGPSLGCTARSRRFVVKTP